MWLKWLHCPSYGNQPAFWAFKERTMSLNFDGAVRRFLVKDAPEEIRAAILGSSKREILDPSYPYRTKLSNKKYEREMLPLQIELAKLQSWIGSTDQRVAIVFEGRDAAGKGGTIRATNENLSPRVTRVVALSKPSEKEAGEWYFQRYIKHLPTSGTVSIFDRSWYNRAVVEKVFGFCSDADREKFFLQTPQFETMLAEEGIKLLKIWLNVGRAEQLRRFLKREDDPLKHWKLSSIDVEGLSFWNEYGSAIKENFQKTHHDFAPWCVVRSEDKKRTRLETVRYILSQFEYEQKDHSVVDELDTNIVGGPEIWRG